MERAHQNHEKVSADNYLEAGKSANMIALISALFATFISYLEGGAIQPISVLLLSTSVITIIVHKMRQLYLFYERIYRRRDLLYERKVCL